MGTGENSEAEMENEENGVCVCVIHHIRQVLHSPAPNHRLSNGNANINHEKESVNKCDRQENT